MEFFTVPCPGKGKVFIDGQYQGDSLEDTELKVFQCNTGTHDIAMECLVDKQCVKTSQKVQIEGTNPILPMEVPFICAT